MHSTLEEHIAQSCPRCKRTHSKDWKDQFHNHTHYRTLTCECGYDIFIRSKVMTSSVKH